MTEWERDLVDRAKQIVAASRNGDCSWDDMGGVIFELIEEVETLRRALQSQVMINVRDKNERGRQHQRRNA